jgi:hypothetical protein
MHTETGQARFGGGGRGMAWFVTTEQFAVTYKRIALCVICDCDWGSALLTTVYSVPAIGSGTWRRISTSFAVSHQQGDSSDWERLYNDQRNVQVFNLFTSLLLPYMFRAIFRGRCTSWVWFKSPGYGVSAREMTTYPVDLNHTEAIHLPLKMG